MICDSILNFEYIKGKREEMSKYKEKVVGKKNFILKIIFIILMIITCIVIFLFSSQNGEKSSGVSEGVLESIINFLPNTRDLPADEKQALIENSQFFIRKTAHFSVYTLLGIELMGFLSLYEISKRRKILIALLCGVLYAISDEIHQIFSPGRTAKIMDVFIDSCGVVFGIVIVNLVLMIVKRVRDSKVSNSI